MPACAQLSMPNLRSYAPDLLPTFLLPYPASCSFPEEETEAAEKGPEALANLRDSVPVKACSPSVCLCIPICQGSCHLVWVLQARDTEPWMVLRVGCLCPLPDSLSLVLLLCLRPCFAQLHAWHRGPLPAPLGLQAGVAAWR